MRPFPFLRAASVLLLASSALSVVDDSLIIYPTAPAPTPPCFSPFNPDLESSCSRTIATDRLTNVTIRSYEAIGATITFLAAIEAGQLDYQEALGVCIEMFLPYFVLGFNQERVPVNRTVPIVSVHLESPSDPFNYKWASGMSLPASVYPSAATAPVPDDFALQFNTPFSENPLVAVHHFVTPALAADADWAVALGFLTEHVPRGYSAVAGTAPVFAIYDGRDVTTPRNNEVWLSVVAE